MQNTETDSNDLMGLMQQVMSSDEMQKLVSHPQFPKNHPEVLAQFDRLANTVAENVLKGDGVMSTQAHQRYQEATGETISGDKVKPTSTDSSTAKQDSKQLQTTVKESTEVVDEAAAARRHLQELEKANEFMRKKQQAVEAAKKSKSYGTPTSDESPIDGASVLFR